MRVARLRMLGRAREEAAGLRHVAGQLVVLGGRAEEVVGARAARPASQAATRRMQLAPGALEQGAVGHLMQDLVLKAYSRTSSSSASSARHGEPAVAPARAAPRAPAGRAPRVPGPRTPGRSRSPPAARALSGLGSRSSRACSTPVSVGGTSVTPSLSGCSPPSVAERVDGALVDQHLDQLFHVERVAFGAPDDQLVHGEAGTRVSRCSSSSASCRLVPASSGSSSMRWCRGARTVPLRAALEQRRARADASTRIGTSRSDLGQVVAGSRACRRRPSAGLRAAARRAMAAVAGAPEDLRGGMEARGCGSAAGRRGCRAGAGCR